MQHGGGSGHRRTLGGSPRGRSAIIANAPCPRPSANASTRRNTPAGRTGGRAPIQNPAQGGDDRPAGAWARRSWCRARAARRTRPAGTPAGGARCRAANHASARRRRRQLQFIGRLMREVDAAPIRARLAQWADAPNAEKARLHAVERWRERLLSEPAALEELCAEQPRRRSGAACRAGRSVRAERPMRGRRVPTASCSGPSTRCCGAQLMPCCGSIAAGYPERP